MWELGTKLDHTHALTLAIGLITMVFLLTLQYYAPRAPGALIVVVGTTAASALVQLDQHGVAVVGAIPAGLPVPSLPRVGLSDLWSIAGTSGSLSLILF